MSFAARARAINRLATVNWVNLGLRMFPGVTGIRTPTKAKIQRAFDP